LAKIANIIIYLAQKEGNGYYVKKKEAGGGDNV